MKDLKVHQATLENQKADGCQGGRREHRKGRARPLPPDARKRSRKKPESAKKKPRKGPASSPSIPAIPSEDEIMELEFADEKPANPRPRKTMASEAKSSRSPKVKAPPLPPGLDSAGDTGDGEDEFWQLAD